MASRTFCFEQVIMEYLGIKDVPQFDQPKPEYHLGHACGGEQVPHCLKFYQNFFTDFDQQQLGEHICIPKCRRR